MATFDQDVSASGITLSIGRPARKRPGEKLLAALNRYPGAKRMLVSAWYNYINIFINNTQRSMRCLNYGFYDETVDPIALDPEEEGDRLSLQLYHRVAGAVDLRGKVVLEVGCGRGGGSAYVKRRLGARSVTGVDLSRQAVAFCNTTFRDEGLRFMRGDAEDLPFEAASFDAVVNLESSHNYGSMDRFLAEVARVLRPRGVLLFADLRMREGAVRLRQEIIDAGFEIVDEERISPHVVRAMELATEDRLALIVRKAPWGLRRALRNFAAVKGSRVWESLREGRSVYMRFVARRAGGGDHATVDDRSERVGLDDAGLMASSRQSRETRGEASFLSAPSRLAPPSRTDPSLSPNSHTGTQDNVF